MSAAATLCKLAVFISVVTFAIILNWVYLSYTLPWVFEAEDSIGETSLYEATYDLVHNPEAVSLAYFLPLIVVAYSIFGQGGDSP